MGSLAIPRESYSSLGSVFIIGAGGKKVERKVEILKKKKNVQGIHVAH